MAGMGPHPAPYLPSPFKGAPPPAPFLAGTSRLDTLPVRFPPLQLDLGHGRVVCVLERPMELPDSAVIRGDTRRLPGCSLLEARAKASGYHQVSIRHSCEW
jgi:hypothetical protein